MEPVKFVHFGCWNNVIKKKGGLDSVMYKLGEYVKAQSPKFIVVAGDNYYPKKEKDPANKKNKWSVINKDDINKGFDKLVEAAGGTEINMILGNHDLVTNTQKSPDKYFMDYEGRPEYDRAIHENGECTILTQELAKSGEAGINLVTRTSKQFNDTLILCIDTSLYEIGCDKEYLNCYKKIYPDPDERIRICEDLIREQNDFIQEKIVEATAAINPHPINHVIIIGHHPIMTLRQKENDDKVEVITSKTDVPYFVDTLNGIYGQLPKAKYHYLCADTHFYQSSTIIINGTGMNIDQYIVGTGGTELDPSNMFTESTGTQEPSQPEDVVSYTLRNNNGDKHTIGEHGFLECSIVDGPTFKFIRVDKPHAEPLGAEEPAKGGTRRKSHKKSKRSKNKRSKTKRNKSKKSKRSS